MDKERLSQEIMKEGLGIMDTKTRITEVLRTPFTIPTKTIVDDLHTLFLTMAKEMCIPDEMIIRIATEISNHFLKGLEGEV